MQCEDVNGYGFTVASQTGPKIAPLLDTPEEASQKAGAQPSAPAPSAANNGPASFTSAIEQQQFMLENQRLFFEMQRQQIAALNVMAMETAKTNTEMLKMFAAACADVTAKTVHAKPEILTDFLNQVHEFAKNKGYVQ